MRFLGYIGWYLGMGTKFLGKIVTWLVFCLRYCYYLESIWKGSHSLCAAEVQLCAGVSLRAIHSRSFDNGTSRTLFFCWDLNCVGNAHNSGVSLAWRCCWGTAGEPTRIVLEEPGRYADQIVILTFGCMLAARPPASGDVRPVSSVCVRGRSSRADHVVSVPSGRS